MKDSFDFVIIGTGFSGLGMGIALKKQGRHSFIILEKANALGGTWRDNHYPGCACDVPSHLYSFSFEPNPNWSRMYPPQAEILSYLEHCAEKYRILPHVRFGSEMTRAEYDESASVWRVHTRSGQLVTARYLVSGIGALNRPAHPEIPGIERFRGKTFHSAEWNHDFDLRGKRVAVVGTGASAIQFVPQIAPDVDKLHLFQRTAPWVLPRPDRAMTARERRLFARTPLTQRLYRYLIYWIMELGAFGFTVRPEALGIAERAGRRHIRRQIRDPELRAAVTPTFTPGCKRILLADDYYPALERPNVELVTEQIVEATPQGLVTNDGVERPVDAIIFGTGFRVNQIFSPLTFVGRGGAVLNQVWRDGIRAYLGTTVAGFPNFFMLTGPNTGLGHNSMVFMIESQINYILDCVRQVERRRASALDVRPLAQAKYNDALERRLGTTVWASGCKSWYLDENGKNRTLWPGFTVEFWLKTRRMKWADYEFDPLPSPDAVPKTDRAPERADTAERGAE